MALVLDTGVLYASLDRDDRAHRRCRKLLEQANEPLVVPSPVLPEVDYWVSKHLGAGAMVALLRDVEDGAFVVENLGLDDYRRVAEILDRYADQDVGFVDGAVLAVVERLGEPKLATLDRRHFTVLRPRHVDALQLVPS
jgi:predicted nucleic acid-binding protein